MSRIEKTVFISYRHAHDFYPRILNEYLTGHGYDVFFDYRPTLGIDSEIIFSQIAARTHFILILTQFTLEPCQKPDDWLRKEIEYAIEMKRHIICLIPTFEKFEW